MAREWIERKWPRRLLLLPFGLGMLGYGVWLVVTAVGALVAGAELAGARDCPRGVQRDDCIVERFGRVASGRFDYNRRGPDDLYVTLVFRGGGTQEVQIAYESDWRELPDGEPVWLRSLNERPLEVTSPRRVTAMAALHPLYSGMNSGLEASAFLAMGLGTPFIVLALERRGRRETWARPLSERLGRWGPWFAVLIGGLCFMSFPSLLLNLRPATMAYVALATALGCAALVLRQGLQRSRMKP